MKKAICVQPVEIYDEDLRGIYAVNQIVEGPQAEQLLERYAEFFRPLPGLPTKRVSEAQKETV